MSDEESESELGTMRDAGQDPVSDRPTGRSDESGRETEASAVDRAADSFVALETELRDLRGEAGRLSGLAEDAERIPASAVPEGYPATITTAEALRVRVVPREGHADLPEERASVYVEWPPGDDGPLARLLALRDVRPAEFADLHGESIPLAVEDGFLVPRLPPAGSAGDPRGVYGILLGLACNLFVAVIGLFDVGWLAVSFSALAVLLVLNVLVVPVSTYLDARYLLTRTDWDQGPLFWATLAAVPGVNVVSSLAYLSTRQAAEKL